VDPQKSKSSVPVRNVQFLHWFTRFLPQDYLGYTFLKKDGQVIFFYPLKKEQANARLSTLGMPASADKFHLKVII